MGSVNHATGRKIPFFQWIHVMQLFFLVSKLQRMAEIFASLKMCKLPRCYSERQKPFLHLKFRDQKHSEQLYLSLLNLLYDTTDVFWRGMCWWEMLCWLAGARPGFSVARKQRNLWWVLWASVFWTSHQLSTMLLNLSWELEVICISFWELGSCARFVSSLTLSALPQWVLLSLFQTLQPTFCWIVCVLIREKLGL